MFLLLSMKVWAFKSVLLKLSESHQVQTQTRSKPGLKSPTLKALHLIFLLYKNEKGRESRRSLLCPNSFQTCFLILHRWVSQLSFQPSGQCHSGADKNYPLTHNQFMFYNNRAAAPFTQITRCASRLDFSWSAPIPRGLGAGAPTKPKRTHEDLPWIFGDDQVFLTNFLCKCSHCALSLLKQSEMAFILFPQLYDRRDASSSCSRLLRGSDWLHFRHS